MKKILLLAMLCLAVMTEGCKEVDDDRTPPAGVWIVFPFQHDWTKWGVTAALQHREFVLPLGLPQGFNYTAASQTGFGGVLLVGDIHDNPAAYDMSCPVENRSDVRIVYDEEHNDAYCPRCGSRYSVITNYGKPTAGPAADDSHPMGLRTYNIAAGANGEYRVIRP